MVHLAQRYFDIQFISVQLHFKCHFTDLNVSYCLSIISIIGPKSFIIRSTATLCVSNVLTRNGKAKRCLSSCRNKNKTPKQHIKHQGLKQHASWAHSVVCWFTTSNQSFSCNIWFRGNWRGHCENVSPSQADCRCRTQTPFRLHACASACVSQVEGQRMETDFWQCIRSRLRPWNRFLLFNEAKVKTVLESRSPFKGNQKDITLRFCVTLRVWASFFSF